MNQLWFRPLVWIDYRVAVILTVIVPLGLLIWSFTARIESMQRLLVIYWRVASLLMITVYLFIASIPYGFITSLFARVLIPLSLWFWVDVNDEIKDLPPTPLKWFFTSWRWAVTVYCSLGAIATLPFLPCAFSSSTFGQDFCQVWLQPPWGYKEFFHAGTNPSILGFFGMLGLAIYVLYFAYFLCIRLAQTGRSALEQ
ncbi:MAG: hypothetical protein N5P05_000666 [Chroococcopsis gigantea SAG 12.99]|jgi:hypothetical protein|nr:DUF3177 family protein [Chlorogloea purpurea SAG 13.99]MDV2999060.1 hypothetical protein [Chroococcopsis gigantea SAG 12.99]